MDVKKLLVKMSVREKVCQLTQVHFGMYDDKKFYDTTGPESILYVKAEDGKNFGSILGEAPTEKILEIQEKHMQDNPHKIPLLFCTNVVHGFKTIYPIPLGLAGAFDMELVRECAAMGAKEATVCGRHLNYAPMADTARDARWGRVMESAGEGAYLSALVTKANVEGFQGDLGKYKMAACVKHFAAYGGAEAGRDYNTVDMSEYTLRNYYLPAYKAAVDAGVTMVMSAFNTLNGVPVTGNKWILKDVLRDEWGFDGVLITDFRAVKEMITHGFAENGKEACFLAADAGVDIEMMSSAFAEYYEELIAEGRLTIEQLDTSVERVLRLKDALGLLENPTKDENPEEAKAILLCDEHRALARKAAEESAVLLKNDGVLPFSKTLKRVAVIGPHANTGKLRGQWRCSGQEEDVVTVFDGVKNALPESEVVWCEGVASAAFDYTDESGIAQAKALAKTCDAVVLCLGEDEDEAGEGKSRMDITLPQVQYKLLDEVCSVNKNAAVLLFTGRPLAIKRLHETAPAIVNMWWPGTEGGNAAASILFGDKNPSGKLTMTFPAHVGQCPIYYNHYRTGRPSPDERKGKTFVSAYFDGGNAPLYPFGYGLSYSKVEYSEVVLDKESMRGGEKITATVRVKNAGRYATNETVQLYIADTFASIVRPVKELKGFEKVALAVGEEKTVSFEITEETLAFYGADGVKKAEKGEFKVYIGTDSSCKEGKAFRLV